MFKQGVVKSFQQDRGFGFIQLEEGNRDIFFHIKDFPHRDIPVKVGERVKFEIVEDQAKLRAAEIIRLDIAPEVVRHTPQSRALSKANNQSRKVIHTQSANTHKSQSSAKLLPSLGIIIIIFLAYAVYNKYQEWRDSQVVASQELTTVRSEPVAPTNFQCDGREHCSQMSSYEEALFFLKNCPNTKMDGDADGIPCEKQF